VSEQCHFCVARELAPESIAAVHDEHGVSVHSAYESMLRRMPHWWQGTRRSWEFLVRMNFADVCGDPRNEGSVQRAV
jgi:hypothetical protein